MGPNIYSSHMKQTKINKKGTRVKAANDLEKPPIENEFLLLSCCSVFVGDGSRDVT